jgi:hypothetical protein
MLRHFSQKTEAAAHITEFLSRPQMRIDARHGFDAALRAIRSPAL